MPYVCAAVALLGRSKCCSSAGLRHVRPLASLSARYCAFGDTNLLLKSLSALIAQLFFRTEASAHLRALISLWDEHNRLAPAYPDADLQISPPAFPQRQLRKIRCNVALQGHNEQCF
ncbi:hypothetical protein A0H81_11718 [Grifola frondosa]|uniref:Uncharacterized protein n=1 Tax=Grifola frondosa TaxID=5627 RepID=A0A1C7LZ78_GRIFR|nr:hypothetical protein A0H81_11718 [Grifola frondosa]